MHFHNDNTSLIDLSQWPVYEYGMTLEDARAEAVKNANEHGIDMVVGWQIASDDCSKEYGYCPAHAAGNAFVVEVLETISPTAPQKRGRGRPRKS
jgi:hypothetical protein